METPSSSSSRRITRSQTANNKKTFSSKENEESLKSRQRSYDGKQEEKEKPALFDITNSSPIVGLAMGNLNTQTPQSSLSKNRVSTQNNRTKQFTTPGSGSGEALLRSQVKTLLQKVEEEAAISKISLPHRHSIRKHGGFVNSPMSLLLAPTPANTPQIYDYNASESFTVSPVAENFNFSQMLNEIIGGTNQEEEISETEEKNMPITRSLFMDLSEKFEGSQESDCTSEQTYQGCENKSSVDSDASAWSVQANASTSDEQSFDREQVDDNGDEGLDDLCNGMSKISVQGGAKFSGKHTRFVYNSDDELEGEEEEDVESTPKGKPL